MAYLLPAMLPRAIFAGNSVTSAVRCSGDRRAPIKIVGGYRSRADQLADLQASAGDASRNFWAFGERLAAAIGAIGSSLTWSARNGGKLPIVVSGSGGVGMVLLERRAHRVEIVALSGLRRLLGQQTRRPEVAVQAGPRADRRDPPAPPPIARARSLGRWRSMLAGFGSPLEHDCSGQLRTQTAFGGAGWGVDELAVCLKALQGLAERLCAAARRVGDSEPSSERLAPFFGETLTLWGGPTHVNA